MLVGFGFWSYSHGNPPALSSGLAANGAFPCEHGRSPRAGWSKSPVQRNCLTTAEERSFRRRFFSAAKRARRSEARWTLRPKIQCGRCSTPSSALKAALGRLKAASGASNATCSKRTGMHDMFEWWDNAAIGCRASSSRQGGFDFYAQNPEGMAHGHYASVVKLRRRHPFKFILFVVRLAGGVPPPTFSFVGRAVPTFSCRTHGDWLPRRELFDAHLIAILSSLPGTRQLRLCHDAIRSPGSRCFFLFFFRNESVVCESRRTWWWW